jgi:NitT/TauT family transport system substrate-binding protein
MSSTSSAHGRRALIFFAVLACVVGSGCRPSSSQTAAGNSAAQGDSTVAPQTNKEPDRVTLLLNWYPEAEHGGFYAAQVHGIFQRFGLEVKIKPGGRSVVVAPELTLGRVQFGVGNADDVLMARSQDAPIVALMAPMQNGPRCILVREDSGIQTLEQLKNVTLQIDSSRPYVPFLKSKGLLNESVQLAPYFGTVAQLVAGPGYAQQAYNFSEPLLAEQAGVKVRALMMSDIGYNPYCSCLLTTEAYLKAQRDLVQRMVLASVEGWKKYLEAPEDTNRKILSLNDQGMTAESLAYGVRKLTPLCYPEGFPPQELGRMSPDRWKELRDQLVQLKLIDPKVSAQQAFADIIPQKPTNP